MMEELYGIASSTPASGFSSDQYYSSSMAMPENLTVPDHHQHQVEVDCYDYYHKSAFEPLAAALGNRMPGLQRPDPVFSGCSSGVSDAASAVAAGINNQRERGGGCGLGEEVSCEMNAKIASHPLYPKLLQAYIDCQKVGAPPEVASVLDEIRRESDHLICRRSSTSASTCMATADPELDAFMETYCDILVKYKSDLTRPFDEAITFLNKMETQLITLSSNNTTNDGGGSSDEEDLSGGETSPRTGEEHELKDKLLRKYSGYISTLKHEFSKKKKKGKLPREARQTLFDWWNLHDKWPYPTEADKISLAQVTGLDQKQINNWFINQRKRHWKPSENMQFAVMDTIYRPCFTKDC